MSGRLTYYRRASTAAAAFLAASGKGVALALARRDRSEVARDTARTIARWVQPRLGVRVEVEGEKILYDAQPCIYVSNHQSVYDVPILGTVYPTGTVVVGKRELRWTPFFGWLFTATGNIWIDRSRTEDAVHRLQDATEEIRQRRVSVWVFPEGTRGPKTGELLPFKKGPFRMAIDADVPLVPVVVSPLGELFDAASRRIRPGIVQIRVLDPEPVDELTPDDTEALRDRVRTRMQAALKEVETRPA